MAAVRTLSSVVRSWTHGVRAVNRLQKRAYTTEESISLTFSSPSTAFYDRINVKQVDVFTTTGMFGVLPRHVPSIAVLRPSVVTVHEESDNKNKIFVSSGSMTINSDSSVQILAEEGFPLDQLDLQAAQRGLEKCQQQLSSASTDQTRAEAQIGVDLYEAMIDALK